MLPAHLVNTKIKVDNPLVLPAHQVTIKIKVDKLPAIPAHLDTIKACTNKLYVLCAQWVIIKIRQANCHAILVLGDMSSSLAVKASVANALPALTRKILVSLNASSVLLAFIKVFMSKSRALLVLLDSTRSKKDKRVVKPVRLVTSNV